VPKQTGRQLYSTFGLKVEPDYRMHEEAIEKKEGKPFNQLSLRERVQGEAAVKAEKPGMTSSQSYHAQQVAEVQTHKRELSLNASLSKADRGWLESRNLHLPGYYNKIKLVGTEIYLTKEETERYGEIHKELYEKAFPRLRELYARSQTEQGKQNLFTEFKREVNEAAKKQMLREINSKSEKKPKYSTFQR